MALWGNTDAQASAPKIVVRTDGDVATSNTARLGTTQYGNTVYAVSATEMQAESAESKKIAHAGWVVKRDRGNGRVQYETLVAMGSISGDAAGGADDAILPNFVLRINTQPVSLANVAGTSNAVFTVVASSRPAGATLGYLWQANTGSGFANLVANASITGVDTATVTINPASGLGNAQLRVIVSTAGANSVTSNVATLAIAV